MGFFHDFHVMGGFNNVLHAKKQGTSGSYCCTWKIIPQIESGSQPGLTRLTFLQGWHGRLDDAVGCGSPLVTSFCNQHIPLVNKHSYGKLPIYSWFTQYKIVIFHSYVSLPEGIPGTIALRTGLRCSNVGPARPNLDCDPRGSCQSFTAFFVTNLRSANVSSRGAPIAGGPKQLIGATDLQDLGP